MNIYVNRSPVHAPWGGGNAWTTALFDLLPKHGHKIIPPNMTQAPEAIVIAGLDADHQHNHISAAQAVMYRVINDNCRIVLRVNENDARKGTKDIDSTLLRLSEHVDGTVFVSKWLESYFMEKGWECTNNTVIYNAVDSDTFKPGDKLNNGKVNIVAHHWSNNELKGFDVYDKLDEFVGTDEGKDFTFTYIGRHRNTFKNTKTIRPMTGKPLGEELGKYDVYVSASRFDPGPNHVIESIACGLPTYVHEDGGGCVEFAGNDHTYAIWDELKAKLLSKKFETNTAMQFGSWETCINDYNGFLEATCKKQ